MNNTTQLIAKKIIAHNNGMKMWEAENFGNVWVVWNFNDNSLQDDAFEVKWAEMDEWLAGWEKENKGYCLEFIN